MTRKKKAPARGGASRRVVLGAILVAAGVGLVLYATSAGRRAETPPAPAASVPSGAPRTVNGEPVPPFHESAEAARPFPALLDPGRFEIPVVARAYEIAHEIPEVLAQQPCYCNCGVFGHGSLLDCFASEHGAT